MLRLMIDEDMPRSIVRGLRRHQPDLDLVRVQDIGLRSADDRRILERAAAENRIVVTKDRQTMIGFAYDRVTSGQPMPGLIVLHEAMGIGETIEQILMAAICTNEEEMQDRVLFLPL